MSRKLRLSLANKALNPDLIFRFPYKFFGYKTIYHINQVYPEFNSEIYRQNYNDLKDLNDQQLKLHWINYGKNENRNCSKLLVEPPINEPPINELPISELTINEPIISEPIINEPIINEPIISEPIISEPIISEPIISEPIISEPIISEHISNSLTSELSSETINELDDNLWEIIDKIFYINLNSRKDRNDEIQNEFLWAKIPSNKIQRIEAIYNKNGAIGCTSSHIKCMELAISNNYKNILILEDDFNFNRDSNYLKNCLNFLKNFNEDWDVILFSANVYKENSYNEFLNKVLNAQTTSGYLVNSKYFGKLLSNFKTGLNLFRRFPKRKFTFAIDSYWKNLQPIDRWFVFKQKIGYQRSSFSDIEKTYVKYNC